jgi:hypothetical protein
LFEQRAAPDPGGYEVKGLWVPPGTDPQEGDLYVAIDEIFDGVVTFAVARWPHIDGSGRLAFDESERVSADEANLYELVCSHRHQEAWNRPLRIGDVFLVRGGEVDQPAGWDLVIDVSSAARDAAKVAVNAVAAPVFHVDEELPDEDEPPEPPAGPIARPMV